MKDNLHIQDYTLNVNEINSPIKRQKLVKDIKFYPDKRVNLSKYNNYKHMHLTIEPPENLEQKVTIEGSNS